MKLDSQPSPAFLS